MGKHRRGKVKLVLLAAAVGALLLTACANGSGGEDGSGGTTVRFGVGDPQLQVGTAPYTSTPEQMGYWKDHGLNVESQGTEGAVASVQGLLTGNFDIVNGGSTAFYEAAAKDPSIRIISLGADNIWKISVPPDSPIKTIDDLKGTTIGAQSKSSSSYLFGRAALSSSGLDPDDDVKWLAVGVGAQAAQALRSGQIDAYASYEGPLGVVGSVYGKQLRPLESPLDQLTGTLGLATTADYLKENEDTVVAFLEAYNEGKVFADENPRASIQLHWKEYPAQAPKDQSTKAAVDETLPIVEERWAIDAAPGTDDLVGYLDEQSMQESVDFFRKYGLLENEIDVDQVSAMNVARRAAESFDKDTAIRDAKQWKP